MNMVPAPHSVPAHPESVTGNPAAQRPRQRLAVLLFVPHAVTERGLRLLLHNVPAVATTLEADARHDLGRFLHMSPFDLIIMDFGRVERPAAFALLQQLARAQQDVSLIICADDIREVAEHCRHLQLICECFPHGRNSVADLSKAIERLFPAASAINGHDSSHPAPIAPMDSIGWLTTRERQVLALVASGRSSKEIAAVLSVSLRTVESHRSRICTKLNERSIAGLTKIALRAGLTSVGPQVL